MTFDAAVITDLFAAIESKAQALAVFRRVNMHDSVNAPSTGLSCSITLGPIASEGKYSGQNSVSGTITFLATVWNPLQQRPLDPVDSDMLTAVSALMNAFSGGFTLGGVVRNIDLLNMRGEPGYIDQQDTEFRVYVVSVPIVISDLWAMQP